MRDVKQTGKDQTGRYNRMEDVLALMVLMGELCGPEALVFFDFGVVSIINVDLSAITARFAATKG